MIRRGLVGVTGAVLAFALSAGATNAAPQQDNPLLNATKRGDVVAVRSLLEGGADPDAARGDGLSALHLAAQQGSLEIAQLLIGSGATVEAKTRIGDYTPLHLASGGAHASVVRALIDAGADPAAITSRTGVTPLHLAAKALNGESTVRTLLEHGVAVDAREYAAGQTALMFAAARGRAASVRELLSHDADPVIRTEVVDVLERMTIDREAEGRLREALTEVRRSSPGGTNRALSDAELQEALALQREFLSSEEQVQALLADFDPDDLAIRRPAWDTPSGYKSENQILARPQFETLVGKTGGMTALLHASREGHIGAAVALLDRGADIDQVSGDGSSPLVIALLNGRFDLAMRLIERGANPNIATTTDGISPLFAVLQTQWALKYTDHPQPRAQDNEQTRHMEVLNALLEAGADPNVALKSHLWHSDFLRGKIGLDLTGATPFWRATLAQDLDAMRALATFGADPNMPTTLPEPGLREGRQNDGRLQDDSGLPMLSEGTPNMYAIHAATGGGYMGLGPFMMNSVPNNFLNVVKYLVEEHGADVNLPDGWGYTPLHYASVRGGNDLIEYLVSQGADVKAVSRLGQSTADLARGGRAGYFSRPPYPETVELLQSLGSELKCLNSHFRGTGDWCPGAGVAPFDEEEKPNGPPGPGRD